MQTQSSLLGHRRLRHFRSHLIPQDRINDFKKNNSQRSRIEEIRNSVETSCVIFKHPYKYSHDINNSVLPSGFVQQFEIQQIENEVALYDQSTYMEAKFNHVHTKPEAKAVWADIAFKMQGLQAGQNFMCIYLKKFQDETELDKIFLNQELINRCLLQPVPQQQNIYLSEVQHYGIIERALQFAQQTVKQDQNETLLVSVLGFSANNEVVDLLNFGENETQINDAQKKLTKVKLKKDGDSVVVENLTQIGIESVDAFLNTFLLCKMYKDRHQQVTGKKIEVQVYQIAVGKLSPEKEHILGTERKYNFVLINSSNDHTLKNSLAYCFRMLAHTSEHIPARSSKLTFMLKDCINAKTPLHIITQVDNSQSLKSQIELISFNQSFTLNKPMLRKNYWGDRTVLQRLKHFGNKQTLIDLAIFESREDNLLKRKIQKLGMKYSNSKVNRALLSETISSTKKRRSLGSRQASADSKQVKKPPSYSFNLSGDQKRKTFRYIYMFK